MAGSLRTVGCFMHYRGKFLLLLRRPEKSQGNTWGLPAGKVEPGETDEQAMVREVKEETGYQIASSDLTFLGTHTLAFPDITLIFPTYRIELIRHISVKIDHSSHQDFKWVTRNEAFAMPNLTRGLQKLLKHIG